MPVDTLPEAAKGIYEKVYQETLTDLRAKAGEDADSSDLEAQASKIAWGAVKKAGYRKNSDSGTWQKMLEPMHTVFGEELDATGEWVEVACTGDVVDMHGQRVSIEEGDFDKWIEAFETGARGQDLPITYDHPKRGGVAAGWFRGLRKGEPRKIRGRVRRPLLLHPEWTPAGRQSISDGDYRYFSLEITPDNILRGGSLVNYPAIKGLRPVTQAALSEGFFLEEFLMAQAEKCTACGAPIPDGAKACPACGEKIKEEKEEVSTMAENTELASLSEELEAAKRELDELRATSKLHEELQGKVSEQASALSEQQKQIDDQENKIVGLLELNNMLRLHERVTEFMQLSEHKNRVVTPAYEEQIIGFMLQLEDTSEEEKFLDLLEALAAGTAVVELGERGTGHVPAPKAEGKTSAQELHMAAVKLAEEQKIPYRDALIEAAREV